MTTLGLFAQGSDPDGDPTVNSSFKETSVLMEGEIYKLSIQNTGVHVIDFNFLRDSLGIDPSSINVDLISILGNEGRPLREKNTDLRTDDLEELPLSIIGNENGTFGSDNKILFYAEGSNTLEYTSDRYQIVQNPYSLENYVYLKIGSQSGKKISDVQNSGGQQTATSLTDAVERHELELVNLLAAFGSTQGSGQTWYGEELKNLTELDLSQQFELDNIDLSQEVNIDFSFVGRSSSSSSVTLAIDNERITEPIRSVRTDDVEATYARPASIDQSIMLNSDRPSIIIQYPQTSAGNTGWLDYLQLSYKKELIYEQEQLIFHNTSSIEKPIETFEIRNANSDLLIWDITNIHSTRNQLYTLNADVASFTFSPENELKKFIVFDPQSINAYPGFVEKIDNQNLHAIDNAELLIVYHNEFADAADRFKRHRETHSQLNVKAINVEQIYNEFASGKQDPTAIRDFVKMIYDRDPGFKFLLLFGDGSYDFRWLDNEFSNQSFVPPYETIESLNPLNAFPTDDYYALLSNGEGGTLRGALDIAVGRIPAKTSEEANNVVEKIIRYDTEAKTNGDWKNRIVFIADDEDSNIHLNQSDRIAVEVDQSHPSYNQEKIYFDAFQQVSTPGGARYPDVEDKLNNEIFKGAFVINYLGHGGPKGWSQERVLKTTEINSWRNTYKLPLIITATCSFTGFDDPALVSGGEEAILNRDGGAVALFSTVRSVFSSQNFRLTQSVFDTLFSTFENEPLAIGEILRRAKNTNSADTINLNARKFLLIGDPSMQLTMPRHDIEVTKVNGLPIDAARRDTIRALQKVSIEGRVVDSNGDRIEGFDGTLFPTLFDKEITLETLSNDPASLKRSFKVQRNVLYSGTASITNGEFSFEFVLPKDINYSFGNGKLSLYATEEDHTEAAGFYEEIIVGGTDSVGINDDVGPVIDLFMNDETFVNGGITNASPELLIKLFDDNGINFSGTSIGHDITAILDDDTQNTIILNDFYKSDIDNFRKGLVRFPLNELSPGLHKIKVKAFDVLNNTSESLLEFYVLGDEEPVIKRLLNYPNPFTTSTTFMFEHSLPNTSLSTIIDIYTISGKLVKTVVNDQMSSGFRIDDISWDGKDDYGNQLGRGIYLYKVKLLARDLGITINSDFEKLLLLR